MQSPSSPLFSDSGMDFLASHHGHPRRSNRIDHTKLKTRMCRNYMNGMPCPFEDRCAFSHSRISGVQSPTSYDMGNKRRLYQTASPRGDDYLAMDSVSESQDSCGAIPPPPTYEAAISEDQLLRTQEYTKPPAYPSRFRYDPYSYAGIMYEQ